MSELVANSLNIKGEIEVNNERSRLAFLSFLKFIAAILIVYSHVMPSLGSGVHYATRMCEFLFVSAGFCVGYNYYAKSVKPDMPTTFSYVYKKFLACWPLHIICLALVIILKKENYPEFDGEFFQTLFLNASLLHSWRNVESIYFSFNGPSWFLASITFCYFLSPLLLQALKRYRLSIILFVLISALRILIEFAFMHGINPFDINFHVNPVTRSMEFFTGMLIVPTFFLVRSKLERYKDNIWFKIHFTLIEIAIPALMFITVCNTPGTFNRGISSQYYILFTFVAAFGFGYFEKLFSFKVFQQLFSYQLEIYLLQLPIHFALDAFMKATGFTYPENYALRFALNLAVLFTFAIAYKELIFPWLTKGLDKCLSFLKTKIINPAFE